MELALLDRPSNQRGARLAAWIALSLLTHVVVLTLGTGYAPVVTSYRPSFLIVDISYRAPEMPSIVTDPEAARKTDSQRLVPKLVRAAPLQEPPRDNAHPAPAQPFPFDTYFNIAEVDTRAEPINDVLLRYPWVEYQQRLTGVVRFALYINAQGTLDKVQLLEAVPPGHFEEAAWEAVKKLQFNPARRNGRPVKSQKTIDVIFDPNEDFSKPIATQPEPSVAGK